MTFFFSPLSWRKHVPCFASTCRRLTVFFMSNLKKVKKKKWLENAGGGWAVRSRGMESKLSTSKMCGERRGCLSTANLVAAESRLCLAPNRAVRSAKQPWVSSWCWLRNMRMNEWMEAHKDAHVHPAHIRHSNPHKLSAATGSHQWDHATE